MQTIGKYEVLEVIGHGGMGVVYRARDNAIGRDVALKVMGAALAQQGELRERFLREARAAGNLQHPNIVVIYDLGEDNGAPYIAMEYLAGQPLDKALAANGLTTKEKLETFALICDGLHFAHQNGVIHRDVKPANVILLTKGGAKLVDFGIARTGDAGITRTGMMLGTVAYMAPEQLKAKPVDARSDVFSAGAMLYEMLAGKLPFEGESTAETMMKILQGQPPELKAEGVVSPQSLAKLVNRALEKEPEDRYQTAREFGEAVRDYLLAQELSGMMATSIRPRPELPVREQASREPAAAAVAPAATRMSAPPDITVAARAPQSVARAATPLAQTPRDTKVQSSEGKGSAKKAIFVAAALAAIFVVALLWNKLEKQQSQSAQKEVSEALSRSLPATSPSSQPASTTASTTPASSTPSPTPTAKLVPTAPPPTMHTTASGVKYWDTKEGTGAVATKGKTVTVSYRGHLTDGTPFDKANAGKPLELPLGKGMLIKGWEEGVEGMKVGGKRRLRVPPEAGYGATGAGAEIPPNSTLIFDIQLLSVK